MSVDLKAADFTLQGLKPYPAAITTVLNGRENGLMSLSLAAGGIIPEAPRVTISITKYNFTHNLILESGVFVAHILGNAPDVIDDSLNILMTLGGSSGRDGEKLTNLDTKTGETGAPILQGALSYVECRVLASLDAQENTIFLADVVAAGKLREGGKLNIGEAWGKLPKEWLDQYNANHHPQLNDCRRQRGLPTD
jgi:flavin reductase (DIM6/NTAB) family NADH-FMN oxidoreductase RutF